MKGTPRILLLTAALLPLLLFLFPMWRITLKAPQYPEGITMLIWINQITGDSPSTLQNINILNHYVGMKSIEPNAIPELTYFPFVVIAVCMTGLLAVILRRRSFALAWTILFVVIAAVGMYDFYLWEYDYGHNLSPTAPIKIPGMAYQPPLFGSKMLLNFQADSYPAFGGMMIALSIALGFASVYFSGRDKIDTEKSFYNTKSAGRQGSTSNGATEKARTILAVALSALTLVTISCTPKPQAINYGHEGCDYCSMKIVDARYGSEIVTRKGKVYTFDAIECMINFEAHTDFDGSQTALRLVNTYTNPGVLIPAEEGFYLISDKLPSPMGMYLTGFDNTLERDNFFDKFGGERHGWGSLAKEFHNFGQISNRTQSSQSNLKP